MKDESSINALFDALKEYVKEAEQSKSFCGFVIDELRDSENKLLALRLVLCDDVMGNAARRI